MQTPTMIIGAGLSGLLAAHAWPGVPVLEARPATDPAQHRAVLRFRSDAVARMVGIPFRKVLVRKSIWSRGEHVTANPRLANLYARKCVGALSGERSIWDLAAAERWVAPEDLYEQLLDSVKVRVHFSLPLDAKMIEGFPIINTAPLPAILGMVAGGGDDWPRLSFERAPIHVRRYRIPLADVHQTVYFPEHDTVVYRASITGDLLTIEARLPPDGHLWTDHDLLQVSQALGLDMPALEELDSAEQRYGKIIPLSDAQRRGVLSMLTLRRNIYSLGRFATWRNSLMDDVIQDIAVIKRLLRARASGDHGYEVLRQTAG